MTNHLSRAFFPASIFPHFSLYISPPPRISFSFTSPPTPVGLEREWHLFIRVSAKLKQDFLFFVSEATPLACVHSRAPEDHISHFPSSLRAQGHHRWLKSRLYGVEGGGERNQKKKSSLLPPSNFHAPVASSSSSSSSSPSSSSKFPPSPSTHSPARLTAHGRGEIFFL